MYVHVYACVCLYVCVSHLSHWRKVHEAMIHNETMNTSSTVPGQMVIRVLRTNRVLKLILFNAPMLREEASVKSWGEAQRDGYKWD